MKFGLSCQVEAWDGGENYALMFEQTQILR